jgi:glycosyltransferase involved in cell wall biosynthesis
VAAPLVIVGGRGWLNEDENALLNDIAAGAAPGRVRRFDYMPYPLLISLVRGARAVLFPSLYEGFGLPVLEAMALNTPVLTSTQGALPEVAGDAALLVDPYYVDAIKAGIRALDNDEGLRRHLAAEGLIQARKFSPDAYRVRLKGLYRRLGAT